MKFQCESCWRQFDQHAINMGISYRKLSEASGCSQYKIMTYVRLLEPIVEETD